MIDSRALSTLIGSIYDCALDPSRWEGALAGIRNVLACQIAVLGLFDSCRNRFLLNWTAAEIDNTIAEHFAGGCSFRAWPVPPASTVRSDGPHGVARHLSQSYLESSPYVENCLKPQGIIDIMSYVLVQTPARFGGLSVARDERQGIFTDDDIELIALLMPHVRRAVTISNLSDACTIERMRLAQTLDALRCPVLLTDARSLILHANAAAAHMLRHGSAMQGTGGVLQARDPSAAAELRAAIKHAAENEADIGKTGLAIRLTQVGAPPVSAHVLPLTAGEVRTRLQPSAVAAVFISTAPDGQDGAAATAAAFDLTPAETRVLASLLAGRTLAETAQDLEIAFSTTKTHLDHIFAKTGVTRQADLMRLASGLVPPTGARS